jgi:hypothetical protein
LPIEYLNNKVFEGNIARFKQSKQDKARYELILDDLAESNKKVPTRAPLLTKKQTEYHLVMKDYTESQNQLAMAFFTLSENIIRYRKFHFVDVDDAVQEFVMICFEKIDRFDPKKGKAFNYMTTCILNHYRQLYRTARNYNELKKKYHDHLYVQAETVNVKSKSTSIAKDKFSRL